MTSRANYQPRRDLPTEFALAVACCRWTYSAAGAEELRRLAKTADWSEFLRVCRRHRVQGLAWHALSRLDVGMPAPVRVALGGDARAIADHGLRSSRESLRLADSFAKAGLPLLFLKGLTVGKLAYGNPFLKMGWDIDLLVLPADVAPAAAVLGKLGYGVEIPANASSLLRWHGARKESAWRGRDGLVVDLHSRVADQPALLPAIDAESPAQIVNVAPGIDLATLADDALFAYLCVHGASSAWFRLKWITDLAALLNELDAVQIEQLYQRSQELAAGRAAAQALLLAERVYGIPLSPALAAQLDSPVNRWLARVAVGAIRRGEPTERPLGTGLIHLTQFVMVDGAAYKFAELRRQMRAAGGLD